MGRRLTTWERQEREQEREERAAERREKTEERRSRERKKRERQKASEKHAKDAQTEAEIAENRAEVALFDNYIDTLGNLHNKYNLNDFEKEYEGRLDKRTYTPNPLKEIRPFKEQKFGGKSYKVKPYKKKGYRKSPLKKNLEPIEKFVNDDKKLRNLAGLTFLIVFIFFDVTFWSSLILAAIIGICPPFILKAYKKSAETTHDEAEAEKKAKHDEAEAEKKAKHDENKEKQKQEHEEAQKKAKSDWEERDQKNRDDHEQHEAQNKKKFDENDSERIKLLETAKNGDIGSAEIICESIFPIQHNIEYPEDFVLGTIDEYEVGYNVVDPSTMDILIQFPVFDDVIPTQNISVTSTGKTMQHGELSSRAITELTDTFVCSLAFEHVIEVLRAFPYINNFNLEAFNVGVDTITGGDKEFIILKVAIAKETLMKLNLGRINPVHAMKNFDYEFMESGKKSSKEIQPDIDRPEIVWSTLDDKGFEIPYGVHPDQTSTGLSQLHPDPEPINYDELEEKDGVMYTKDTNEAYSGQVFYLFESGEEKGVGTLKYGKRNGLWTFWYENGKKSSDCNYKDGKHDGLWTSWYESGQKEFECNYKDGKLNGLWTSWYESGQKKDEVIWKDEGIVKIIGKWNEDGTVEE